MTTRRHGGERWEPNRRMLFNPPDHEPWLVWVCLLCFNPEKRARGGVWGGCEHPHSQPSLRCDLAGAGVLVSLGDPLNQPLVDEIVFFSHQRPSEARMCYTQQPLAGCSSVLTGLCVGASSNDSFVILLPGFFWGAIQA